MAVILSWLMVQVSLSASFLASLGEGWLSPGLDVLEPGTSPLDVPRGMSLGFLPQLPYPGCPAAVVPFPP